MQGHSGSDNAKQTLDKATKLLGQNVFAKHLAAGTASGWFTGYLVRHTGKSLGVVLGSGIIIYEIAHHQGYVKQDWDGLRQIAQKKTAEFGKNTPAVNKVRSFATKNKVFTAGFVGGFLIGIAI